MTYSDARRELDRHTRDGRPARMEQRPEIPAPMRAPLRVLTTAAAAPPSRKQLLERLQLERLQLDLFAAKGKA